LRNGEFLVYRSLSVREDETETRPNQRAGETVVKEIRRAARKHYFAEEKVRIVLEGLRGEDSIAELYRREGIPPMCTPVVEEVPRSRWSAPAVGSESNVGEWHVGPHSDPREGLDNL
jgi:hypothetical protein